MASNRTTCAFPQETTSPPLQDPRNGSVVVPSQAANGADPTSGHSLFSLLSQGRRHASSTSSNRTGLQESLSSLQMSLASLQPEDDDLPNLRNYGSRQEWLHAMINVSLDTPAFFDEAGEETNVRVGGGQERQ